MAVQAIDGPTGALSAAATIGTHGSIRSIAFAPGTAEPRTLFVGVSFYDRPGSAIVQYSVDAGRALTRVGEQTTPAVAVSLAAHPNGRFLYAALDSQSPSPRAPMIATYALDAARRPSLLGAIDLPLFNVSEIVLSPSARHLVVASPATNAAAVYSIDASSGALTPAAGSPFEMPGAFAVAFHPAGRLLFTDDARRRIIWAHRVDPVSGVIGSRKGVTTGSLLVDLDVSEDGRFLFGADLTGDVIWRLAIDEVAGALTVLGSPGPSTEGPAELARAGRFLYMTNRPNGFTAAAPTSFVFGYATSEGALTLLPGFPVRPEPVGCPGKLALSN